MRSLRAISTLMLLVLVLSGCSSSTPSAKVELRWDGSVLAGADINGGLSELKLDGVTVHYGLTTPSDVADRYGRLALSYLYPHRKLGQLNPGEVLHLWIVPRDVALWPKNVPVPPPFEKARAMAPRNVVTYDQDVAPKGLDKAVGVAASQPAGSPAYTVDWLHEGMGAIAHGGWYLYPTLPDGTQEQAMLQQLTNPTEAAAYAAAAHTLASLVSDRYGLAWTTNYDRKPADLTPGKALLWATGAADEADALALWKQRREYMAQARSIQLQEISWKYTMADMSPIRLQPKLSALPKGPGPNDNYSPHSYNIDVKYDPATRTIAGTQRVTWQNGESIPVDTLYFNLWANAEQFAMYGGGIAIEQVQVDGKAAAHKAQGLDLQVPLGRKVAPGETAVVEMRFTTRLPSVISVRDFGQDGATQRFNLAHWFPVLAVLDDRGWNLHALSLRNAEPYAEVAKYQVKLDVPSGTQLAATGARVGRVVKEGRWIYEYAAENVRDFIVTGGTKLREETVEIDGIAVHLISEDGPWFQVTADELKKSIPFYNQKFGRYPYKDLVVSCCVGMEWPQLIFTEPYVDSSDKRALERYRYVVHHELGHEWFYGFVGDDQFGEPWMDEGFTTYMDRTFFRSQGWAPYGGDVSKRQLPPPAHVSYGQNFWMKGTGNFSEVYFDGARTLEDLEALVGADTMDRLMKDWVRQNTFKTATTAAFMAHAQKEAGRDLMEFFHQHGIYADDRELYQPPIPLGQVVPK